MSFYGKSADEFELYLANNKMDEATKEYFGRKIKTLRLLDSLSAGDMEMLFDIGPFGMIARNYMIKAMENCEVDVEIIDKVLAEYYNVMDLYTVEHMKNRYK